jgi:broad-specificity NMP kinase
VVIDSGIRKAILKDVTAEGFTTIGFTLKCSEETLAERHKKRGDTTEVSFRWLRMEPYPGDYVIDTDRKTAAQVADEIKAIIDSGF